MTCMRYDKGPAAVVLLLLIVMPFLHGMKNPAAVYCEEMGYEFLIINDKGYCKVEDYTKYEAFSFYTGRVGTEYGFCYLNGYRTVVEDEVQYCELPNGTLVDIDRMMDLDFKDMAWVDLGECGDNFCRGDEKGVCPEDCGRAKADATEERKINEDASGPSGAEEREQEPGLENQSAEHALQEEDDSRTEDQGMGGTWLVLIFFVFAAFLIAWKFLRDRK